MKPKNVRKRIIEISKKYGHGHIAPALSTVEILCALDSILNENDKFVMSKGHACLALYAFLQIRGLNPDMSCGHPEYQPDEGIECTTGSLGHGLPIAVGMALAKKLRKESGNVYVLMSDGECQEGSTWESLLIASHHKLNNLIVIIDYNKLQALDFIENVLSLDNLFNKIIAFNCDCIEVFDGHDIERLKKAINIKYEYDEPKVIIAHTIKGMGLPISENKPEWHHRFPSEEDIRGMEI